MYFQRMRLFLIAAALKICSLMIAAQAAEATRAPVGTVTHSHAGLPFVGDVTITFLIRGGEPDVVTVTRINGRWHVAGAPRPDREERCRYRADARRLITGRPLTQGVPRWCMSERDRRLRPDPSPRR